MHMVSEKASGNLKNQIMRSATAMLALGFAKEIEMRKVNQYEIRLKRQSIILLAILCALLASCVDGDGAQDTTRGQATSSLAAPPTENPSALRPESATAPDTMAEEQLPEYELVRKNDADQGHISAIRINAVVSGQITEGGLRRLLLKLLAEANSTASQQRVFIYLFQSHEHFESGYGQWIAMLKPGTGAQPDIDIRTELVEQLGAKPEVIGGLSEDMRKEVFQESAMAKDRADNEATLQYPFVRRKTPRYSDAELRDLLANQSRARKMLEEKYESELSGRYGVIEAQLEEIQKEGLQKNWPLPEE